MFTLSGAIDSRALLNNASVNRGVALSVTGHATAFALVELAILRSIITAGEYLAFGFS